MDSKGEMVEIYSTYGRDTSKVTVYVCDFITYMDEIKGENISKNLPEKAFINKK